MGVRGSVQKKKERKEEMLNSRARSIETPLDWHLSVSDLSVYHNSFS
jgi:hypothetical protein